jgi:hypothetical protein
MMNYFLRFLKLQFCNRKNKKNAFHLYSVVMSKCCGGGNNNNSRTEAFLDVVDESNIPDETMQRKLFTNYDYLFKVILIGDSAVGKSCFVCVCVLLCC